MSQCPTTSKSIRYGTPSLPNGEFASARWKWRCGSVEFPVFPTPRVNVFTVTTNAEDVSTTLRHPPHWHTHAAL